jgi:hypothetical protein
MVSLLNDPHLDDNAVTTRLALLKMLIQQDASNEVMLAAHGCTTSQMQNLRCRYNYPDQRWRHSFGFNGSKDSKEKEGIAGTTTLITDLQLTGVCR